MNLRDHLTTKKEERPAPLFCKLIGDAVATCNPKKFTFLSDGLASVRSAHTALKNVFSELDPAVHAEEDRRKHFSVPVRLYHELRDADQKLKQSEDKLSALEIQFEKEKASFRDEKNSVSELANQQRGAMTLEIEKNIEALNREYDKLDREQKEIQRQQRELNNKINRACCGFFTCCIKSELTELDRLAQEQKRVGDKQRQLTEAKNDKLPHMSTKEELVALDHKADTLAKEFLHQKDVDEQERNFLKQKTVQLSFQMSAEKHRFYSSMEYKTIMLCVRAYASFIMFESEVEKSWAAKFAKHNGELSKEEIAKDPKKTFARLMAWKHELEAFKSHIEPLFNSLWSPHVTIKKGAHIYQKFLSLSQEDQHLFLSGKADKRCMDKVAPYEDLSCSTAPTLFASLSSSALLGQNPSTIPMLTL